MRTYDEAFAALKDLTNYETMVRPPYTARAMNLPRTRALLATLGHPERAYPILQVAGTKGKGTTSTALARMLAAGGYRTGLFTSPHLFHFRERIALDGEWISEDAVVAGMRVLAPLVRPLLGTPRAPTFFELMTVLALHHYREARAEAVVLEVGMGGRLDATSAPRPLSSVVTHVGLDHTAVLGKTKALIAAEKAGVAKRGVLLVSGVPPGTAAGRVVIAEAARRGAPVLVAGRDFTVRTGRPAYRAGRSATPVAVRFADGTAFSAHPSVLSRDLARDAGLAAAVLLSPPVRRRLPVAPEAMAEALSRLHMPGRVEVAGERPFLVVDGAHNPDSARSLSRAIAEALPCRRIVAVAGGGTDKAVPGTVAALARLGKPLTVLFTRPAVHPRAADPAALAAEWPGARAFPDLPAALAAARRIAGPRDLIVVTGSLYLAGEALALLGAAVPGSV